MNSSYPLVELGDIATVRSGFAFKSKDWTDAGIPVVKISNVKSGRLEMDNTSFVSPEVAATASDSYLKVGDILISMTGYIGDIAMVTDQDVPAVLNQRVGRFSIPDKERLDKRFLFYVLRSQYVRENIEQLGYGSAQPNISPSAIHGVKVPHPSLDEQLAIASILGALDDKIELNRKMSATLEAMARAIFTSWFVDFDPVRAKAEGRDPGLAPEIATLFPNSFEESTDLPIPVGWTIQPIRDVSSRIQYGLTTSATKSPPGPHFLRITDIQGGEVDWSKVPYCVLSPEEHEKYRVQSGDVLVARTGASTGENTYIVDSPDAVFASYLVRFQFDNRALGRYVGAFMRTSRYREYVAGIIGGSAQPNASAQALAGANLIVPTAPILDAYFGFISPLDAQIYASQCQEVTLASLRNLLLPKLISGEIRVSEAERILEMSA